MMYHIEPCEAKQMMSDSDSDSMIVSEEQIQAGMGERVAVEGDAVPGQKVEIEYSSNAGGSYGTNRPCVITGELLYVSEYGTDSHQIVVRDDDGGRSVRFHTGSRRSLKSLAARRTRRGRSLGEIISLTFTGEDVSALAPAMNPIRRARSGDTLFVEGEEYGVVSVSEYGPEDAPEKFSTILTTSEGEEYVLKASAAYADGEVTFSERFAGYDEQRPVGASAVSSGRFRERYFSRDNEGLDTEDTTDAFPAPHYGREGERVTFTLSGEDSEEQVSGQVTDVRYYAKTESGLFTDPEVQDPETTVELDDGRKVVLKNTNKHSSHVTRARREEMDGGKVRAMVVTRREDADNEYAHVEALDIRKEVSDDSEDGPGRADGGRVMADGGEDEPNVVIPGEDSRGEHYHTAMSGCSFKLCDTRTVPLHQALSRGLERCPNCDPPESAEPSRDVRADGGHSPESLASAVSDSLQDSDIPLNRVSVSVGEVDGDVTVQGNGPMGRAGWEQLRERITAVLDSHGYRYQSKPQWAFVEVYGREPVADGGMTPTDAAMAAVYRAVDLSSSGGPVTAVPNPPTDCSIRYQGPIGAILYQELDARELEMEHTFPGVEGESARIRVSGFRSGGGGRE